MKHLKEENFNALSVLSTIELNEGDGTVSINYSGCEDDNKLQLVKKIILSTEGNITEIEKKPINYFGRENEKYRFTIKTDIPFKFLFKKRELESNRMENFEKKLLKEYFYISYCYDGGIILKSHSTVISDEAKAIAVDIISRYNGVHVFGKKSNNYMKTFNLKNDSLEDLNEYPIWETDMPFEVFLN